MFYCKICKNEIKEKIYSEKTGNSGYCYFCRKKKITKRVGYIKNGEIFWGGIDEFLRPPAHKLKKTQEAPPKRRCPGRPKLNYNMRKRVKIALKSKIIKKIKKNNMLDNY